MVKKEKKVTRTKQQIEERKQMEEFYRHKEIIEQDLIYLKIFADKNSNIKMDCIDQLTIYNKVDEILK